MELPVIGGRGAATSEVLIRAIRKGSVELSRAIAASEEAIDGGVAFTTDDLGFVADSNATRDVHTPVGLTANEVLGEIAKAYGNHGGRCAMLVPTEARLDEAWRTPLKKNGFVTLRQSLLLMDSVLEPEPSEASIQVISARAVIAEYRSFLERVWSSRGRTAAIAREMAAGEAGFLDVDALDVLVARQNGRLIASIGVQTVAEFGVFRGLRVEHDARASVVNTLLWHLLDLCKRSQFRQIMTAVNESDDETISVYERLGMKSIATIESYVRPDFEIIA